MSGGIHIFQIIFLQTFISTIIILPFVLIRHRLAIKSPSYKLQISRALFWACATILFFYAAKVIPVGRAVAITFTVPLFTSVLAVIFLKEKMHFRRITALIIGFIGMLIIINPTAGTGGSFSASILVILAAFMWSTTDIMIKIAGQRHSASVNTFYFSLFSAICTLPLAIFEWRFPGSYQFLWLILLAVLFAINMVSITLSYEHADLVDIMPFVFSELVFTVIIAYFMLGEMIAAHTAIGSAVIVFSTSYITYREKRARKLRKLAENSQKQSNN